MINYNLKYHKRATWLFIFHLLSKVILGSELQLEDDQFKRLVFKHFSDLKVLDIYGVQIFEFKNTLSIQVDIKAKKENLKDTIYQTYKSLNSLSDYYFRKLNNFHIIYHFEDNSFPLATSADKDCLGRFFTKKSESFSNWENNCLNTGSL